MGIGVSVFLLALGAILAFATNVSVSGVDLTVVGYVLMGAGLVGLLVTLLIWAPRRRVDRYDTVDRVERPVTGRRYVEDRPVVEERRRYDDGPL